MKTFIITVQNTKTNTLSKYVVTAENKFLAEHDALSYDFGSDRVFKVVEVDISHKNCICVSTESDYSRGY